MERIEGLVEEGNAIVAALRNNAAMHAGKTLGEEYDAWKASLYLVPGETPGTITDADATALAYIIARWPRMPAEVS